MEEKVFNVSVSWTVGKNVEIKAKNEEEAKQKAYKLSATEGEYVDDSFVVDSVEEAEDFEE